MKTIQKYLSILFLFFGLIGSNQANAQSEASFEDAAFRAMEDEMNRNLSTLKLDKLKSPYYIGHLISDANLYYVKAQNGSIVKKMDKPYRNQQTSVLVGNNERNNLNFFNENKLFGWYGGPFMIPVTLENDYQAIRRSLWAETDNKYKEAADLYESKLTAIKQQNLPAEEVNLTDLSSVPATNKIIPSQNINFNKSEIENLSRNLSEIFNTYPHITKSGVNTYIFNADALYTNNEQIKYKRPFSLVCIRIFAEAIAVDGEPLIDYMNLYFNTPEQIPSFELLQEQVAQMASLLTQLCSAPSISESYSGPVMFEGEAVGEIIAQCFVDNPNGILASRKSIVSSPALTRNYGMYLPKENNIEQLTGKKVVDRTFSVNAVYDKKEYNGTPLIGYFELDAQGVEPEKNTIIINEGVLQTLLTDRIPTYRNQKSNGHNCFAILDGNLTGTLSAGVIEFSSTKTKSHKDLKKKLLAAAKEEDYEYAYIIRKMSSPMAGVPGLSNYMANSNQRLFGISRPLYVYRVNVKTGQEELVRSVKLSDISLKSFKRIIGVANKDLVYNTMLKGKISNYHSWRSNYDLSGAPASFIVPEAIVFEELELEKDKNIVLKKESLVPSPLLSNN